MPDLKELYLTPEQYCRTIAGGDDHRLPMAAKWKVGGSLVSPKAWRVTQRELDAFMRRQTISELLFEQYLADYGLDADHEPAIAGRTSRLDYRLIHKSMPLWFEVKEFGEVDTGPGGAFDPYISIRNRIGKAAKQFTDYKGECCSTRFL